MTSIHVTVPVVFWGSTAPSHEITCITRPEEDRGVATGSKTGQICIWDLHRKSNDRDSALTLCPRLLLFSPHGAIIAMAFVQNWSGDRDGIVSMCDKGILCLWDGKDGTCLKTNSSLAGRHNGVKCLAQEQFKETLIAVWGHYSSIYLLDSLTLECVCVLKSSHNPNWIAQISFIPNVDKTDALAAVTVDGTLKLWLLRSIGEMKEMGDLFEEKSKALGAACAITLATTAISANCIALIVCADSWQLYDASEGKMKQLLIRAREPDVGQWIGGEFLSYHMLVTWSEKGITYLYQIESRILPGLQGATSERTQSSGTSGCIPIAIFSPASPLCDTSTPLTYSFTSYLNHRWYILGDGCGRLQVWHIDTVLRNLPKIVPSTPPTFGSSISSSLSDSWQSPSLPCSIIDSLYPSGSCPYITCSLYLANFGRLICGQSNGEITVVSATQAATKLLLQSRKFSKMWPQHYFLRGHQGPITYLLYPSDYSSAYNSNYLISGGADFSVKLWDLYKGILIHTYAVHGGAVKSIVTCPPNINTRLQTCVCSIGEDRSVAILSTSQNKCLLLASCHTAPVVDVNWRLEEDFLLVLCADGRLYVWQIETGTLDRCEEGERASIIWETTPKNKQHSITPSTSPIQVRSLSMGPGQSLVHVLLFDPQLLITKLQKMERSEIKPSPPLSQSNQVRAFRTYLSARKFSIESSTPVVSASTGLEESHKYRNKVGEAVAKKQEEVIQPETPGMTINIARLLVSCIHAWNLDNTLDSECEEVLGLVRPNRSISFGLLSRARCLSLVLPGWGLKEDTPITTSDITPAMTTDTPVSPDNKQIVSHDSSDVSCDRSIEILNDLTSVATKLSLEDQASHDGKINLGPVEACPDPVEEDIHHELSYHVRWQLSRSLTTQHLLTIVSITNTLMNQSIGAHALAARSLSHRNRTTSESTESDQSDDEEDDHTLKDNMIRAIWSKVAALHCVMLPERMANYFRPPHLPVLAARFMDRYQAIREAAQALLQAELRREGKDGRRRLVTMWAGKLQSIFTHSKSQDITVSDSILEGTGQPTPTQQQQMTALVILGMIGAEFNSVPKATPPQGGKKGKKKRRDSSLMKQDSDECDQEALDPQIARQTAKTLQAVLLEKPVKKNSLYSSMRCSAAELIGRGFHVWENHVDVQLVVMGLLDLVVHHSLYGMTIEDKQSRKFKEVKFMREISKRALNLMILLRPVTIVDVLAKEVTLYLGTHHSSPFPHSAIPGTQVGTTPLPNTPGIVTPSSSLLVNCRREVLQLIHTILDKCSGQISLHLIDVVNIVLFCLEPEDLKRKNFQELFPSLTRLSSVSYNLKTKRLAVGARSGQINIYDLKQRKTQTIMAHSHLVTVLSFSEDGKFLATYSYGDSLLQIWHVGTSLLGGMISQTPKCIHSWPAISSSPTYSNYVRLEWANNKIIVLYMPGGIEYRYSM